MSHYQIEINKVTHKINDLNNTYGEMRRVMGELLTQSVDQLIIQGVDPDQAEESAFEILAQVYNRLLDKM